MPIICPIAFGTKGEQDLDIWLRYYNRSNSTFPVIAITDDYKLKASCDIKIVKHQEKFYHPQHRAGYLKMIAVQELDFPVISVDCDLIIKKPLDLILPYICQYRMALGLDQNPRKYKNYIKCGKECNSGLIWLNDKDLFITYMKEWGLVKGDSNIMRYPWADEMVCTAVMRSLPQSEYTIYPKTFNYSRKWNNREKAIAVHYHGSVGKKMMKEELNCEE